MVSLCIDDEVGRARLPPGRTGKDGRIRPILLPKWEKAVCGICVPLQSRRSWAICGADVLADLPVRDYVKMPGERPAAQRVNADRKARQELMKQKHGA